MRRLVGSHATLAVTVVASVSCSSPSIRHVQDGPNLRNLPIESVISGSDSFFVSGVVSTPSCDILLSESRFGGIVRVGQNGISGHSSGEATAAEFRGAQLEDFTDDTSVIWSRSGGMLGLVDHESLAVQSLPIPGSGWGVASIGSVSGVFERWIAVAYLGDGPPVLQPEPWVDAPLVRLVDHHGRSSGTLGAVERQPGRHLSWLLARTVLGAAGRRVSTLFLSTGSVTTYDISDEGDETDRRGYSLPVYIASPEPREELWVPEWIQIGGEIAHLLEVSQVITADFRSDGGVIAIRPYMAEWRRVRNPFGPTQGMWEVTSRGLESYSSDGTLEEAFALPSLTVGRIVIDRHDRLFLLDGTGLTYVSSVLVSDNDPSCPTLPPHIDIASSVESP